MAWPWSYRKTDPELHYLLTASSVQGSGAVLPVYDGIPQSAQGSTSFCPPDPWWLILGCEIFTGPSLEPMITDLGDLIRVPEKWVQGVVPDFFTIGFYSRAHFGLYTTQGCPNCEPLDGSIGLWTIKMDGEELEPQTLTPLDNGMFSPSLSYYFPRPHYWDDPWAARALTGDEPASGPWYLSGPTWLKRPASLGPLSSWGASNPADPMDCMLFDPEEIGQMELIWAPPSWWIGPTAPWRFFEFTDLGHWIVKGWYIAYPSLVSPRQVSLIYPP